MLLKNLLYLHFVLLKIVANNLERTNNLLNTTNAKNYFLELVRPDFPLTKIWHVILICETRSLGVCRPSPIVGNLFMGSSFAWRAHTRRTHDLRR